MKLLFVASVALLLIGCDEGRSVDLSAVERARLLPNSCIELKAAVFLLRRADHSPKFPKLPNLIAVVPSTARAPFSVSDFERMHPRATAYGTVERVLPSGTRLRITRLSVKKTFEGETIAVAAVVDGQEIDVTELFDEVEMVYLHDAVDRLRQPPRIEKLLKPNFAKFCVA